MTPGSSSATVAQMAADKISRNGDRGQNRAAVLYLPASREHMPINARLADLGLDVVPAADAGEALRLLKRRAFTMAIVHLADERSAVSALRAVRAQAPSLALAALMDPSRPLVAAEAMRAGVADLLTWPLDPHELATVVANARDRMSAAPAEDATSVPAGVLFANSPAMRTLMDQVRAVAELPTGVLVLGEHGTGRELLARAVHARSPRAERPFVVVDCASETLNDLESALFGLVTDRRGTGPERRATERLNRNGAVCRAHGGVLYLKNLADAPTRVQVKIAKLLRDREASLDEDRTVIDLDIRLMASLEPGSDPHGVDDRVRRELTERLTPSRLDMPPFRRRREDIPLIATALLKEISDRHGLAPKTFSRAALVLLTALPWPGNGREMGRLVETLVLGLQRSVIQLDDLF